MITEITQGNQLLSLKAINVLEEATLSADKAVREDAINQLKAYNKAASEFAKSFNAQWPDGKPVKVPIVKVKLGDKVNFIIGKSPFLSTESVQLPYVVVDAIADNLGARTTTALVGVIHSTLEPLTMSMTVKAVVAGDTYQTKGGTETYRCAAMVKVEGTREEIQLSNDAQDLLADIYREVVRAEIMGFGNRPAPRTRVAAKPAVEETEEADV